MSITRIIRFGVFFAGIYAFLHGNFGVYNVAMAQTHGQSNDGLIKRDFIQSEGATLRLLDKLVGRASDVDILVGEPVEFGALRIELQTCFYRPPEYPPESAAFLKVFRTESEGIVLAEAEDVFSGWMFASSPGLNALEHPVYDVWVISCKMESAAVPETGTEPGSN